jgi:5,10-methylenetetrahydrofolate reductase
MLKGSSMRLQEKLASGEFVILAEMEPPKGTDVSAMVANAANVKRMVDAFMVPEMSNAVMRMSSLGGALLLQSKGLETVMQVCCRDRNRLALQGDLLAAQALGVPTVMAVAGEEITHGDHHQAKAVMAWTCWSAGRHQKPAVRPGPGRGGPEGGAPVPGGSTVKVPGRRRPGSGTGGVG